MSTNRFVPRFGTSLGTSLAALLAIAALPLLHCSNMSSPPDASSSSANRLAEAGGKCTPNSSKNNPKVCVAADGTVNPDNFHIQSRDNGKPVIVRFATDTGTGTLKLTLNACVQLKLDPGCGSGATCTAETVMTESGPCTYTPTVDGKVAADPIIVTDNCCPVGGPKPTKP
jgi:hypothetical protein